MTPETSQRTSYPRPVFRFVARGGPVDPDHIVLLARAAGLEVELVMVMLTNPSAFGVRVRECGTGAWLIVGEDGGVYRVQGEPISDGGEHG